MSVSPSDQSLNNAKIRIITNSDIRYEGTLYKINPDEKTITLRNVQSFGTEDRRVDKVQPASALIYEYIVFRSIEIKDLIVLKEEGTQEKQGEVPKKEEQKATQPEGKSTNVPVPSKGDSQHAQAQKKEGGSQPKQETQKQEQRNQAPQKPQESRINEHTHSQVSHKPSGAFQFDKMVESLSEFEHLKTEKSKNYETKYEEDDFFDTISSSVASDKKREIENYNDKRMDKDTFGHVPRIHFTTDYNRNFDKNRPSDRQGGYRPRNDERYDNRNNYRNDGRNEPRGENRTQGNEGQFKKKDNFRQKQRREEPEFIYVRKET